MVPSGIWSNSGSNCRLLTLFHGDGFLTVCVILALLVGSAGRVWADTFTWSGDTPSASWHAVQRIDPPTPELYINNFGRIGNLPEFPIAADDVVIPVGFTNPVISEGPVDINDLFIHGQLSVTGNMVLIVFGTLTNTGSLLKMYDLGVIRINGSSLINEGLMAIQYGGMFGGGILEFMAPCTISGGGTINVEVGSLTSALSVPVTIEDQTITGGQGSTIQANLVNNDTIQSNVSGYALNLTGCVIDNYSRISCSNNALLHIGSSSIDQSVTGTIEAADAFIYLTGESSIIGGTMTSSGTGGVISQGLISNSITDVTQTGSLVTRDGATLVVTGDTLTNDGTIGIQYGGMYGGGTMVISESMTLTGTGEIDANYGTLTTSPGAVLTQDTDHTIHGGDSGTLSGEYINRGTIRSDTAGSTWVIDNATIQNEARIEAANTAVLGISDSVISQSPAGIIAAESGNIRLLGGVDISGGALTSEADHSIYTEGLVTNTISNLINDAHLRTRDGATLVVTGSALTNTG
ncbi:hypothetical protein JXA80_06475, partial [bacterium]|nr:hypothetical protein [candidate division CSSED10-310 bacterium]